ncbi:hypothetical protein [Natronolimnobius baerhuensis]|uniref:Uncharacterized protein n=1 Tax=Natronolimnobius baerhuensis TaxID=253108 RepID=A0A202E3V9_9EURY|nr:hypothetical protein [Natronolimnobius baerhuensis]OVE82973.1 hypothetical protein B2G88_18475 [Natronolimnobius baerhuensis]
MTSERATIRPVTLGRLTELTYICESASKTTEAIEERLHVSHRRARETVLEATRIGLLSEQNSEDEPEYYTTPVGERFLDTIKAKEWTQADEILAVRSPHYGTFLDALDELSPASQNEILDYLESELEYSPYSFNQTGIEIVGDWGERLGGIQRNAFTGKYYVVESNDVPANFQFVFLEEYDSLEETAGVDLRQRYLSIPRLRERTCERLQCSRGAFDSALATLCQENVGKLELSGAPLDTAAKESVLGIKEIALADGDSLVSTSQSTQQVMAGLEQFDKQYYYLAVYDRDITFTSNSNQ